MSGYDTGGFIVDRNAPSVRTIVRGSGTSTAITQAVVIFFALGLMLSAIYGSIYTVMTPETWRLAFVLLGAIVCPAKFMHGLRHYDRAAPIGDSDHPRATAFMGNLIIHGWPFYVLAIWVGALVPIAVRVISARPWIVVMFLWVFALVIATAFLLYRLMSELRDPLSGNAVELALQTMRDKLERWKIERAESVAALKREIVALQDALDERDEMIRNLQGMKLEPGGIERSIARRVINGRLVFSALARKKDHELDAALLARFVVDGWGSMGLQRATWMRHGVSRDDWEAMINALRPWALDQSNRPVMHVGKVIRALEGYGFPLPHAATPLEMIADIGDGTAGQGFFEEGAGG